MCFQGPVLWDEHQAAHHILQTLETSFRSPPNTIGVSHSCLGPCIFQATFSVYGVLDSDDNYMRRAWQKWTIFLHTERKKLEYLA